MEFSSGLKKNVELIVPPHKFGEFSELIKKFNLKNRLIVKNLQE